MIRSKFIDLLATFTPHEVKEFDRFVNSLYFNKNKDVSRLFDLIKEFHPSLDSESLTKENLFRDLYPGQKYNDARIRNLLSNLYKLGEKFLQQIAFEEDSFSQKLTLSKELNTRKLSKLFTSTVKELNTELKNSKIDNDYYIKQHNLENEVVEFFATGDQTIKAHHHLIKSAHYNFFNFLVRYFKMKLSLLTGMEFYKPDFDENSITLRDDLINEESIIKEIEKNHSKDNELILVYYYGLQVFKDVENETGFKKMKKLALGMMDKVSYKEKFSLYNCLENACARRINAGKSNYVKELFEIQKARVEAGIFSYTEEKTFHPSAFRNIVNMAINMKEFDWAEDFINKYKSFLHPKDRGNISALSMTILEFNRGNYEKGLEQITKVNLGNFIYKIEVRSLMLMLYYELGYIEEALNLINSFKQFLINDKSLSENQKKRSENFLKAVSFLVKIKSGTKDRVNGYFGKEIERENMIGYKSWLIKKTEELAA